jgi:hypothetical protein
MDISSTTRKTMNNDTENSMKKEAIGALGLAGIGAGLGVLAYGLEKSFQALSGGSSAGEVISGFSADKRKVAQFKRDLEALKSMASEIYDVNDAMKKSLPAFIVSCEQVLPQMEKQIEEAEKKIADNAKNKPGEKPASGQNASKNTDKPGEGKPSKPGKLEL